MLRTHSIVFPNGNVKMKSLTKSIQGNGIGTVLLDGGIGGQSSFYGVDNYIQTTGRDPRVSSGKGLADRISSKLSKLHINPSTKQKVKNITLSL